MKIVHVEDFIHPDAGYQVNMLGRLQVLQGHQVDIVTAELDKIPDFLTQFFGRDNIAMRDERYAKETGAHIHRIPLYGFYSGRAIFHPIKLFRKVMALRPDVVFVHGEDTLTGMLFLLMARWLPFPLVYDCHMLEMASVNKYREYFRWVYRRFFTPIFLKRKIPLIRVVDSDFVEKCLGIPLSHTDLLSLGTDTNHFKPDAAVGAEVRKALGFAPDSFLVLYAGKLDEHKGGKLLGETLVKKMEGATGRKVEFLIIGNAVGPYGEAVETLFRQSENKIVRLPTQRYFDLAKYYQSADLAVFPRQCSMSFFEIQACGVPVLFEENEINDQRAQHANAFTFTPESVQSFQDKIREIVDMDPATYATYSENARKYVLDGYDFPPVAQKYTNVLQRAIDERTARLARA
ncbi:glycosyltransferase family 4 protein [Pandoraea pneumonica]|uniref:glycosyltransferase family 4 protein n=2 Tax=Pandoraea pneumonica TaxID=2508299 RepID=UPI003CFA190D